METADPRARLLRFVRRMPCDIAYRADGYAHRLGITKKQARAALAALEAAGTVKQTWRERNPFYKHVRTECRSGHRCKRPACRLWRESKRLAALADTVAAS